MKFFARRMFLGAVLAAVVVSAAQAQKIDRVEGEVRRVNAAEGKITLRHGPLPNLDMPAMTMVYTAKDPAILGDVKVGDKVDFATMSEGGVFYVLEIKKIK